MNTEFQKELLHEVNQLIGAGIGVLSVPGNEGLDPVLFLLQTRPIRFVVIREQDFDGG